MSTSPTLTEVRKALESSDATMLALLIMGLRIIERNGVYQYGSYGLNIHLSLSQM
jgi:hypothetical protein